MVDPVRDKIRVAIEGKRGVLRSNVIGATVESFPLFRCPKCTQTGEIDLDQFMGKVSIMCPMCPYHETKDWAEADRR